MSETNSGFLSGSSCSYATLSKYNNCSNAEVTATIPVPTTYVYTPPSNTSAPSTTSTPMTSSSAGSSTIGVGEGFRYRERYDASGAPVSTPAPTSAPTLAPNYTPSYVVPNYPPISTSSLSGNSCSGYPSIISAYGGMGSGSSNSCITNYINN